MVLLDPSFSLSLLTVADPRITIGDYTYSDGRPYLIVYQDTDRITIGKFCSFAYEVTVFGGGEHRVDWLSTYPLRIAFRDNMAGKDGHPTSKGPTSIGNDVYVGYRAVILSGVSIGDGSVVGAGSVVTSDISPYTIAAGNPAKAIKLRFAEDIIQELERIAWWDWSIEKIKEAIPFLSSNDVDGLIEFAHR